MESYRHDIVDQYCAVVFKKDKTGELGLVHNMHNPSFIRDYWEHNEKGYTILEIRPIQNLRALKYFVYWDLLPKAYKTSQQRRKKFDFFKYVLGADLSDKYRDVENISELNVEEK